jgi:hypothetical protein
MEKLRRNDYGGNSLGKMKKCRPMKCKIRGGEGIPLIVVNLWYMRTQKEI